MHTRTWTHTHSSAVLLPTEPAQGWRSACRPCFVLVSGGLAGGSSRLPWPHSSNPVFRGSEVWIIRERSGAEFSPNNRKRGARAEAAFTLASGVSPRRRLWWPQTVSWDKHLFHLFSVRYGCSMSNCCLRPGNRLLGSGAPREVQESLRRPHGAPAGEAKLPGPGKPRDARRGPALPPLGNALSEWGVRGAGQARAAGRKPVSDEANETPLFVLLYGWDGTGRG